MSLNFPVTLDVSNSGGAAWYPLDSFIRETTLTVVKTTPGDSSGDSVQAKIHGNGPFWNLILVNRYNGDYENDLGPRHAAPILNPAVPGGIRPAGSGRASFVAGRVPVSNTKRKP